MLPWGFFGSKKNLDPFHSMNEDELQAIIEQWVRQVFPQNIGSLLKNISGSNKEKPNPERESPRPVKESVFETHDFIFIRIPVDDESLLDRIKIFHSLNKCFIYGLSEDKKPYTIILPATVKKRGATAVYRDHILEIKIPKSLDWQMSEIDVDKE